MKKIFLLLFTLLFVFSSTANNTAAAKEVNIGKDVVVKILLEENGNIEKEVMFLPLRKSCEALGYKVDWEVNSNRAKVYKNGAEVLVVQPGCEAILLDNKIYVSSTVFEEKFSVRVKKK
ncbi:Copper amine oxidase N-terminal domain-containing protein [Desulforamulus putei DSM 12395]|uniref:Copper amine oxidase N-terminal domain-containing protein n=1 Tax=Desulforamulus putei DSM 12395 TaxID=1121429 RepID=A0A1M4UTS1_9FIRM|nr:stalk domain-containing protein [Desulforamulus putei]SHE60023.1 Copper amine oxidase N-terminal domain-containing protein [Desulforamulus putei DSM 12395]